MISKLILKVSQRALISHYILKQEVVHDINWYVVDTTLRIFLQWCICWKDQALLHTRAGRTDPKLHFLKPLFQVFKFELDERKIYKKKNTSRPENVSRCFPLKLSVTSGLLNLPQATSKTFNIRKGWQLLAYLTFARKGCTVLFIVLKYGDDKVESYVFAKRCRHLWNIL